MIPTRVGDTQWVGHILLALTNATSGYSGIVPHLQQLVGNQIGSVSKDQQAKANAYLKMLTSKDIILVMYLMFDVLSVLKKASISPSSSVWTFEKLSNQCWPTLVKAGYQQLV